MTLMISSREGTASSTRGIPLSCTVKLRRLSRKVRPKSEAWLAWFGMHKGNSALA
jgi:hypothetical protein